MFFHGKPQNRTRGGLREPIGLGGNNEIDIGRSHGGQNPSFGPRRVERQKSLAAPQHGQHRRHVLSGRRRVNPEYSGLRRREEDGAETQGEGVDGGEKVGVGEAVVAMGGVNESDLVWISGSCFEEAVGEMGFWF